MPPRNDSKWDILVWVFSYAFALLVSVIFRVEADGEEENPGMLVGSKHVRWQPTTVVQGAALQMTLQSLIATLRFLVHSDFSSLDSLYQSLSDILDFSVMQLK